MKTTASNELRALLPALNNKSYFNYGGQGPLPTSSLNAIVESWKKIQELGPFTGCVWPYITNEIESTREMLAIQCGIPHNRLALTENVTSGCVLPLWGLPFSSNDRLLISDCEHPGVVAACQELAYRKGLSIDILPIQMLRQGVTEQESIHSELLTLLDKKLERRTKLVVVSHLLWNTGQLIPIKAIAKSLSNHPNKPFLLVDAAQSFGQIPLTEEASSADIYAFTGHKWALGPEGLGGVAISERVLSEANPTLIGWRSLQNENINYTNYSNLFHPDSRRFEIATSCVPLLAGLRCSLRLLEEAGTVQNRISQIKKSGKEFWDLLNSIDGVRTILKGPPPAGLISFEFTHKHLTKKVVKLLGGQNLWIRDLESPRCLRACVHITTTNKEIITLSKAIEEIAISEVI